MSDDNRESASPARSEEEAEQQQQEEEQEEQQEEEQQQQQEEQFHEAEEHEQEEEEDASEQDAEEQREDGSNGDEQDDEAGHDEEPEQHSAEPEDEQDEQDEPETPAAKDEADDQNQDAEEQAAEPVIPKSEAPNGVDLNDALAKARAIAAKLGSIQRPPPPAAAATQRDDKSGRKRSLDDYRRSASPGAEETGGSRGYNRDRSSSRDRRHQKQQQQQQQQQQQDSHRDSRRRFEAFMVPAPLVGLIIGRGGENLKSIERRHGVRIQFNPNYDKRDAERKITIEGPAQMAEAAKADILEFIDRHNKQQQQPFRPPMTGGPGVQNGPPSSNGPFGGEPAPADTVVIMVPSSKVGLIIGRGGENIRDIQYSSGARVQVQPETDRGAPERPIHLIGAPEQVDIARARIMDVVNMERSARDGPGEYHRQEYHQQGYGGRGGGYGAPQDRFQQQGMPQPGMPQQHVEDMQIPAEAVGIVIGRGGETIKYLQQATGARIQIIQGQDRNAPFKPVTISGHPSACERARQMIEEKVASIQVSV
ncbi:hypothetical protein GQ54DRAFT_255207 [Martensiomyces pterosporus]|nr:hypothetical protein GQ54DRAFT_255207 [Martensiomyces pterosporus]